MRYLGLSALAALALLLPACSPSANSSANGSIGNSMFILTCSLGCPSGAGGQELQCTGLTIAPNQEFVVTFSQNVDPSSVTSETFNIIAPVSGSTPLGTRLVDPVDNRRVIFRPAITFDAQGNPSFGFQPGESYQIVIKGTLQDATGPYIRSVGGKANSGRMTCQMATGSTPNDYVPGSPSVSVFVDQSVPPSTSQPDGVLEDQPADGLTNVWQQSTVRLVFDDIMNPITLANQATHQATFVTILVDVDGDLSTTTDQVALTGNYVVTVDLANLRTILTFTSNSGLPSSGNPLLNPLPRRVVVNFPVAIQDLAGHGLANPGSVSFVPEYIPLAPFTLGEDFSTTSNEQATISSGTWGSGRLTRGWGGGSGRLGELIVRTGAPVDLSTDAQTFPLDPLLFPSAQVVRDLLDNAQPGVDYVPGTPSTWPTINVTDGVFEFGSLTILAGGTLRFHGNNPVRILVRGPVEIQGNATLDIKGSSAAVWLSNSANGGAGGAGGPNAGAGGDGGDRLNNSNATLIAAGAISNPTADINGAPGGGIGLVAGLGAAPGGLIYPASNLPTTNVPPASVNGGLCWTFDQIHFLWEGCQCLQPARPGGGATYGDGTAVVGGAGIPNTPVLTNELGTTNLPANTLPGAGIGIEPPNPQSNHNVRKLDWNADPSLNHLRGGAGGGGGGTGLFGTQTSQDFDLSPCGGPGNLIPISPPPAGPAYQDNSGCGGGGGGGAVQLVSGRTILLDGVIDARGGAGGSADATATLVRNKQSAPGGGGTGGAVRLQSLSISLAPVAGRIDISGGAGGVTDMNPLTGPLQITNSLGGAGTTGLVRMEDTTGSMTRALEAPFVAPFDTLVPESENFLSVGSWRVATKRPESYTGSTSCWMQPTTSFFVLSFAPDDIANPVPALRYGWNMDVIYDSGAGEQLIAYRGPDPLSPYAPNDFQTGMGSTLNHGLPAGTGSYFVVRFQGAKSKSPINGQGCNIQLTGTTTDIVTGSLTPWVRQPSDLNLFSPRPDMVRFCVVFDTSLATPGSIAAFVKGVTNVTIRTQPD
jgi:hypothetical protein